MAKKVTELTEQDRANLLSNTVYSLPDSPSSKGFTAEQIKRAQYMGTMVLFEWLKKAIEESDDAFDEIMDAIDELKEEDEELATSVTSMLASISTKADKSYVDGNFLKATSLKTVNNKSLLGTGNIEIEGASIELDTSFPQSPSDEKAPSTKLVYNQIKNAVEIAEGKTKTLIVSKTFDGYVFPEGSADTMTWQFSGCQEYLRKADGSKFSSLVEYGEYVGIASYEPTTGVYSYYAPANASVFGSQDSCVDLGNVYGKIAVVGDYNQTIGKSNINLFPASIFKQGLAVGDIVLVTETDVPDRWYGGDGKLYKLETTKVDLTQYAKLSGATFTGAITLNNSGSSVSNSIYTDEYGVFCVKRSNQTAPGIYMGASSLAIQDRDIVPANGNATASTPRNLGASDNGKSWSKIYIACKSNANGANGLTCGWAPSQNSAISSYYGFDVWGSPRISGYNGAVDINGNLRQTGANFCLGTTSSPWKDLFISGDVKDGSGNAKYYTKAQIDEKLQDFVEYKTLTIDVKGPEGDTTVLSGAVIKVFDKLGDKLDEKTYQGVALTFRLPKDETFSIEASKSLSVGGVAYFAPTPSIPSGAMTDNVTSIVRYSNTSSISTIQHVKAFLALDTVSLEDKKNALVAGETNPFSVNMTITDPATSTSYEMPIRILEVGTYKKKVNGEEISFVGALCQMCYCLPDGLQFDEREQAQCGDGETFSSDLRYFSATTSGVGDKAFTLLNEGTDYSVGDSVDSYEASHSVYVFKNGLRNNSNQLSADADMVRYGSNIYHHSNIHKWLNGGDEWFEPSYVGDICSYSSRKGFLTWISQNDLSTIEDSVAYGVYERSGYELTNNEVFAKFVLPSVTNFAGSGNANEGNVSEYWKWKNGSKISNGENASRVMQKITAKTSNQYMWFRSPNRSASRYSWNLSPSGGVYNYYVYCANAVSPLFTI